MAQNSDALQEPSMDELLASIREIIEENTGIPSQNAQQGQFMQAGNQPPAGMPRGSRNYEPAQFDSKRSIRVQNGNMQGRVNPANDSQRYSQDNNRIYPGDDSRFSNNAYPAASDGANVNNNFPARNSAPDRMSAGQAHIPADSARAHPIQDSMNALAERIGLHKQGGADNQEMRPGVSAPAPGNFSQMSNNQGGRLPSSVSRNMPQREERGFYPGNAQNSVKQAQQSNVSSPAFLSQMRNVAASAASARPGMPQGNMPGNAAARSGAVSSAQDKALYGRNAEAGNREHPQTSLRPDMRQDINNQRNAGNYSSSPEREPREDGNFPSDVEHSAEDLLRPYIAQWLDEHFKGLFEKILREEVQRFIQSMRGNR